MWIDRNKNIYNILYHIIACLAGLIWSRASLSISDISSTQEKRMKVREW
jgi:hypothetical protein